MNERTKEIAKTGRRINNKKYSQCESVDGEDSIAEACYVFVSRLYFMLRFVGWAYMGQGKETKRDGRNKFNKLKKKLLFTRCIYRKFI